MKKRNTKKSGHVKKIIPLIIYILLLIISIVMINNVGGVLFYALFFSVVLYLPVSLLYILYIKAVLMIYQEVDGRIMYKNRAEKYSLTVENAGPFVIGGIRLSATPGITSFSEDFTDGLYELLPHEKKVVETDIILKYAGSYEAGITGIVLSDIFGIIRIKYHIPAPLRVSVLPLVTDIAERQLNRLLDEVNSGRKIIAKDKREDTLGNELRSYTAGDPVKQIHWKNYARSGELFIRLPEYKDTQMPTVLMIPGETDNSIEAIEKRDYFLEFAVSVANYFAKRREPVAFIIDGEESKRMLVEDYESFQKFYIEVTKGIKCSKTQTDIDIGDQGTVLILREEDNTLCLG